MTSLDAPLAPADRRPPSRDGGIAQSIHLWRALGRSPLRRRLALLAAGIVVVVVATAAGQVRLNTWQGSFYDALDQRDLPAFVTQLGVFTIIIAALLSLQVAQAWLHETGKIRLREWVTGHLIGEWLQPGRAYALTRSGKVGTNPDQRVHEDARLLSDLSADLGVGFLQSTLLLGSFVTVLWVLSEQVAIRLDGRELVIPGYMVWCALAYAVAGAWLTWPVGRPLVALNAERYAREAELRFALVRISENAEGIALYGGEAGERAALDADLRRVVGICRSLVSQLVRLTWITAGHGWLAIVVPIVVAAPGYFGGDLSFGDLIMVAGAFTHVQASLRWFVDNFTRIAEWRAALSRVRELRQAILGIGQAQAGERRLVTIEHPAGRLEFQDVVADLPDGSVQLVPGAVEVAPGDRLLIVGAHGAGKSTLFRAIAGLWPWGQGRICVPDRSETMFLPQRPYIPPGTLADVLAYPGTRTRFGKPELQRALERVDLGYLSASLDRAARWDRELAAEEQQRLAFARLLLNTPRWVILDEALDALGEEHRQLVLSIFQHELAGAAVVSIGSRPARNGFYGRIVNLVRRPAQTRAPAEERH